MPRGPQGRPVLVQAGSSESGRDFATHLEKETAQSFYSDLKNRVIKHGRDPAQVHILPGLNLLIASSEQEAKRQAAELNEIADPEVGRKRLSARFGGHGFFDLPLDRALNVHDFSTPATVEAARSRTEVIVGLVEREAPTLRQLLAKLAGAGGHFAFRRHTGTGR
jgi:alkanesulfonate monooxygenase SsuD/methylene tetrahydromethanopterin reductase-like flavin-dependent oxidoreductase (luciferase family)